MPRFRDFGKGTRNFFAAIITSHRLRSYYTDLNFAILFRAILLLELNGRPIKGKAESLFLKPSDLVRGDDKKNRSFISAVGINVIKLPNYLYAAALFARKALCELSDGDDPAGESSPFHKVLLKVVVSTVFLAVELALIIPSKVFDVLVDAITLPVWLPKLIKGKGAKVTPEETNGTLNTKGRGITRAQFYKAYSTTSMTQEFGGRYEQPDEDSDDESLDDQAGEPLSFFRVDRGRIVSIDTETDDNSEDDEQRSGPPLDLN